MIKKFLQKIFKSASYGLFFQIYGKIKNSIKHNNDSRIIVKEINFDKDLSYNVYSIIDGRLYTDRIQDTAILIDDSIIDKPSFQFRYTKNLEIYNSNVKDNVVFKKGTPRKLKKLRGTVLSLLTGGGGNSNYWHWLFDVLPRLHLCQQMINLNDVDFFLIPDDVKKFQKESLDSLNIPDNKRLSSKIFRHIQANKLITTDHPVVISGNATKDIMNMPVWISKWLKSQFIKKTVSNKHKNLNRIYIDRNTNNPKDSPIRFIENENEIKQYLISKNFTPTKLHELKFMEQVELFSNAEFIVGLHGSGFANLAFCRPNTKVVEMKSLTAGDPIKNLSEKNKLIYESISVKSKQVKDFNSPNQHGTITIDVNQLKKIIEG